MRRGCLTIPSPAGRVSREHLTQNWGVSGTLLGLPGQLLALEGFGFVIAGLYLSPSIAKPLTLNLLSSEHRFLGYRVALATLVITMGVWHRAGEWVDPNIVDPRNLTTTTPCFRALASYS